MKSACHLCDFRTAAEFALGLGAVCADHWGMNDRGMNDPTATPPVRPASGEGPSSVRLDVWLWAVRLFKTRSQAAEACRLGRVTRPDGEVVKPSRPVRTGDEWWLHEEFLVRRVRVGRLLQRRVGAKLVSEHLTDLTPAADIEQARARRVEQRMATPVFVPGAGRPTKAQRRALEAWHRAGQGAPDDAASGESDE